MIFPTPKTQTTSGSDPRSARCTHSAPLPPNQGHPQTHPGDRTIPPSPKIPPQSIPTKYTLATGSPRDSPLPNGPCIAPWTPPSTSAPQHTPSGTILLPAALDPPNTSLAPGAPRERNSPPRPPTPAPQPPSGCRASQSPPSPTNQGLPCSQTGTCPRPPPGVPAGHVRGPRSEGEGRRGHRDPPWGWGCGGKRRERRQTRKLCDRAAEVTLGRCQGNRCGPGQACGGTWRGWGPGQRDIGIDPRAPRNPWGEGDIVAKPWGAP